MTAPVVIVGSGLAGYTLAREFRKLDTDSPLVILSRDAAGFYSKPMLSNALSAKKTAATLVMKDAERMAADLGASVRPRTVVRELMPDDATLKLDDGSTLAYRDLVLALGADPIRLPLGGDAADEVLSVNDLDDFARFAERLDGAERITILGAGLIGCEFANDLLAREVVPNVIDIAPGPLGRLLPDEAAAWFRTRLETAGINFHLAAAATSVTRNGNGYRVQLDDGHALDADLVLSAVGLRPRIAVAEAAGLDCNRGIRVDRMLATTRAGIWALGDCAEVAGLNLPFVMPIMQQARALAATLAGTPTPVRYPPMPVVVKTPACPTVVCPPPAGTKGTWRLSHEQDGLVARYVDDAGRLLGFALLGGAVSQKAALTAEVPSLL